MASHSLLTNLKEILDPAFVLEDSDTLQRYARTTLPQSTQPLAIVQPSTTDEVCAVLRLAAAERVPVYAISTGKNWGYGDACAPESGMLIIDLSRMKRIIEVNPELAYAVVEPGVTQGQLSDYLRANRLPLVMDCTGAGPNSSLIGNTMERGFGHSMYGDRYAHSCAYEAVLADGSLISTGFGVYPNAQAQHVYKWGVGPSLDGLFTQSNMAIVTRMTLWLMPKPEAMAYYFITFSTPQGMAELAERLRPLYVSGTLRNVLHCANDYRLMASAAQFPWDEADGKASLEMGAPAAYRRLYATHNLSAWSCAGVLMGGRREVSAARARLAQALRGAPGLDKFFVLSDRTYVWSQRLAARLPDWSLLNPLRRDLMKVRWMVELLNGEPSDQFLSGAHWRSRERLQGWRDPLETGAGLIWLGPVLPMTGRAVEAVNRAAQAVFREFGFEYQVTFSFSNERSLCAIMSISFDRRSAEETDRARHCEARLFDVMMQEGFVPYRGSPEIQRALCQAAPAYWKTIGAIKRALDPQSILAPGRYSPPA